MCQRDNEPFYVVMTLKPGYDCMDDKRIMTNCSFNISYDISYDNEDDNIIRSAMTKDQCLLFSKKSGILFFFCNALMRSSFIVEWHLFVSFVCIFSVNPASPDFCNT